MKTIAIIGHGYVGKAVHTFFKDHFDLITIDIKEDQDQQFRDKQRQINMKADLAIICVPTPEGADHSVDLSMVRESVDWLETPLILIKSTIPPGTVDSLVSATGKSICFSPEYIGEGKYVVQWWKDKGYPHPTDMKYHDFQIVGGDKHTARAILEFFKSVAGPEINYQVTDAKTAELVKYMENSWGATKVTFCNEFALIAQTLGVDYDELRELFLLDGRVERMHTAVFKENRGFGGKCFPKDVHGIVEASKQAGYEPKLLEAVLSTNDEIRKLNPQ